MTQTCETCRAGMFFIERDYKGMKLFGMKNPELGYYRCCNTFAMREVPADHTCGEWQAKGVE